MDDPRVGGMLRQLGSRDPRAAWAGFLDAYSPLLLDVVRHFERDEDAAGDCYLFMCEQLCRNGFRRLRCFRTDGAASFATWLRAVARNLCLDWHRQEFGRHRVFESIARLPALDQEIFSKVFVDGLSADAAHLTAEPKFPGLTLAEVGRTVDRIEQSLTPRQRWLLSVRRARGGRGAATRTENGDEVLERIPGEGPDPESLAALREERAALHKALASLSSRDRLVIRLRFGQELTLEEIARLLNLDNAQSADRRIREATANLRRAMTPSSAGSRKAISPVRVIQAAGSEAPGPYRRDGHE
jgi:RNA polymerase sigma factor (sigma-70 family)